MDNRESTVEGGDVLTPPPAPPARQAPRPDPRFEERACDDTVRDAALREGYTALQADLIARRISMAVVTRHGGVRKAIAPRLDERDDIDGMPDLARAAERIVRAIRDGEVVGVCCDHDADGVDSAALIWTALVRHFRVPPMRVMVFTTHRLVEGYGLSDAFCDRLLNAPIVPTLLITADQGTSDELRIRRLKDHGIDTIVSDHHGVPADGPPPSAYATVNPMRADSAFDPTVCGCYVAWVVMQAVGRQLQAEGRLPPNAASLDDLADYVALATEADAVDLGGSKNNRAVVIAGLQRMRAMARPCWQAFVLQTTPVEENRLPVSSQTLSFSWGPMINARGRVDEAMAGVQCLLSSNGESALEYARMLDAANHERKGIERMLNQQALALAAAHVAAHRCGLVLYLPDGNPGVHGVTASRVTEAFGRPVICLSPKRGEPGILTGSARSIDGVNLRECMAQVEQLAPGCVLSWGGHGAALGLRMRQSNVEQLIEAFDLAVRMRVDIANLGPVIWHDGEIPRLGLDDLAQIEALDPFGRKFEVPTYSGRCRVRESSWMGDGTHMRLTLETDTGASLRAVWFGARSIDEAKQAPRAEWRVPGIVEVALQPSRNRYLGRDSVQWFVRGVRRLLGN